MNCLQALRHHHKRLIPKVAKHRVTLPEHVTCQKTALGRYSIWRKRITAPSAIEQWCHKVPLLTQQCTPEKWGFPFNGWKWNYVLCQSFIRISCFTNSKPVACFWRRVALSATSTGQFHVLVPWLTLHKIMGTGNTMGALIIPNTDPTQAIKQVSNPFLSTSRGISIAVLYDFCLVVGHHLSHRALLIPWQISHSACNYHVIWNFCSRFSGPFSFTNRVTFLLFILLTITKVGTEEVILAFPGEE